MMPRVRCKSCREWTEAQVIAPPALLMCRSCGTLCDEPDRIELDDNRPDADAIPRAKSEASDPGRLPKGCTLEEIAPEGHDASRRDRPLLRMTEPGPKRSPVLVAIALLGIVTLFAGMAGGLVVGQQLGLGILTLPPAALALVFVYITFVPDGSRAVLTMGDGALSLARTPFPWRKRYLSRRFVMHIDARARDEASIRIYEVVAVLQSGERVVLLGGIQDPRIAAYLARRAQEHWS